MKQIPNIDFVKYLKFRHFTFIDVKNFPNIIKEMIYWVKLGIIGYGRFIIVFI